ncbi:Kinase, NEK [Giardia muris]|uniref:Kinase, NEK n=1 Tax=Giardia muris TaxID=5742 RepID=A0A4Z1SX11_GIAMU|nr:Kinase, NEK [Giardia muris]|eukprot:TNJ28068.1 Kinase, NEK [Giardia muris]
MASPNKAVRQDGNGMTALMRSLVDGDLDLASTLVYEAGKQNRTGVTALMYAARYNRVDLVKTLLEVEAERQDSYGRTALMYAAEHGHAECVRVLCEKERFKRDQLGWTALMWAARGKHKECVGLLLDEIEVQSSSPLLSIVGPSYPSGVTGLIIATINNDPAIVELLLEGEKGIKDSAGCLALDYSKRLDKETEEDYSAVQNLLLGEEKACEERPKMTSCQTVFEAAEKGRLKDVRRLHIKPGEYHEDGWTALMYAAWKGHCCVISALLSTEKTLVSKKRFKNIPTSSTALMITSFYGNTDCVKELAKYETKITNISHRTALMYAAENGHTECVRILRDHERGMCTNEGETALILAARKGQDGPASLLLEEACMQDRKGYTALMYAAEKGHIETVRVLCELEAGVANSTDGFSALMYALINEHFDCAELLQSEAGMVTTKEVTYRGCVYPEGTTSASIELTLDRCDVSLNGQFVNSEESIDKTVVVPPSSKDESDSSTRATYFTEAPAESHGLQHKTELKATPATENHWTALMIAAHTGNVQEAIENIGEAGQTLTTSPRLGDWVAPAGLTALMLAARRGNLDIVLLLLEKEAGMVDTLNMTALRYAIRSGDCACIEALLCEFTYEDNLNRAMIREAKLFDARKLLRSYVCHETDDNGKPRSKKLPSKDRYALIAAAISGDSEKIKKKMNLLQWCDYNGWTALMFAVYYKHKDCVELLLKEAASKTKRNAKGFPVGSTAGEIAQGDPEILSILSDRYVNCEPTEGKRIVLEIEGSSSPLDLMVLAASGDVKAIRPLLVKYVRKVDHSGMTALMHAASRGQTEVVRLLRPLEARLQDGRGWTALMHAVGGGHEECVGLLLLERDLRDGEGRTAEDVANGLPKEMQDRMLRALRKPLDLLDLPPELGPFTITGLVGNDKTGIVYTACNRSHRNCLLRVVRYSSLPEKTRRAIGEEVRILPSLRHENVLSCLGVVDDPPQQTAYFVFPWHPKVLLEEIRDRREAGRSFGTDELWKCIRQIANGMQHLHEHDWSCRGLSPASIYLSKDGKCVLAPFELAQPLDAPLYLAPEIQRGSPHDPAADVWTLGAIVYEMCAGVPPFKSVDEISSGAVPRIGGRPGSLTDLVARMLSSSPESRPSIQECLRSVSRGSDPHPPQRRSEDRFMEALRSRGREAYEEAMSLFKDGLELSPEQEAEACRLAIANGWSRMAEQFKEAYRPEEGRTTMLMCAAMDRNLDLLRRYVHERRRQDENGWTALMHATIRNHPDSVKELLDEADIKSTKEVTRNGCTFPAGTTAKDIAKRLKDEKLIRVFSKHNGRSAAGFRERAYRTSEGVDNPLIDAAKHGRDRDVRKYLNEYGGKSDKDGWTALMYAADGGYHECVSLLVEKEVRLQNKDGWTALMLAAQAGHLECARILLPEAWIRTTRPASDLAEKGTAMMLAAQAGHADIVELLWPYECCGKDANDHNAYWYAQKAAKNGERIREILDLEGQGKVRRRENIPAIEDILGRKE